MRVKVCGITSLEEAELCVNAGADALGFLVGITHLAEDKIDKEDARDIIKRIPPYISTVAVTHLIDADEVIKLCRFLSVSTVQIHNSMSVSEIKKIREKLPATKIIKTFHIDSHLSMDELSRYVGIADAFLLDTRTETRLGGTGLTHDWNVSSEIVRTVDAPFILAGGLTPKNLKDALQTVFPLFGVDVNSGVETNGKKDFEKVKDFIDEAKKKNYLKL